MIFHRGKDNKIANSKKACKKCGEYTSILEGKQFRTGFFCTMDHAIEFANEKVLKNKKKAYKKETVRLKKTIKRKSEYVKSAQKVFNDYVRERDRLLSCISCGDSVEKVESEQGWKTGGCWDAGHFKSRGAKKQLRFNLLNCHKQCKACNGGSGQFSGKAETVNEGYQRRLIEKIGIEKVEWLENNNEKENQSIEYIERIQRIFKKKTKRLKTIRR